MSNNSGALQKEQVLTEQAKNAKILSRKQIQKRLQGLKTEQYERISNNLRSQNQKLKAEVKNLSEKVQQLVQSRKINKTKNPQIEQQLAKLKRQLDVKYQSMGHLKEQVNKAKQSDLSEEMRMKIRQHSNIASKCHKQLRQLQAAKQDLKANIQNNDADLEQFIPSNQNDVKIDAIKIENKELRGRINRLKEELTAQEKNSKSVISKIYELKDSQKQRTLAKSTSSITASLKELKSSSVNQITELQRQIQNLRNRKKDMEKDLVTDKIIKQTKKSRLQKDIKDRLQAHKELYKRRVKGVNQLNLYQHKQIMLKQQLEKETEINSKTYEVGEAQTDKVEPQLYRKESIGKNDGLAFNDAEMLEYRAKTLIKGVTVYKSPQSIVFTKFHYESLQGKKYQSQPPFQRFVLKKCEAKKYESKSQAPLVGLIVSVHPQTKRVVRFELKWGDSDSSVIGWQVQGSVRFPFDIAANQKPICMFGSVAVVGKYTYVLESLGCEINSFDL